MKTSSSTWSTSILASKYRQVPSPKSSLEWTALKVKLAYAGWTTKFDRYIHTNTAQTYFCFYCYWSKNNFFLWLYPQTMQRVQKFSLPLLAKAPQTVSAQIIFRQLLGMNWKRTSVVSVSSFSKFCNLVGCRTSVAERSVLSWWNVRRRSALLCHYRYGMITVEVMRPAGTLAKSSSSTSNRNDG